MTKKARTFLSRLFSTLVLWAVVVAAFILGSHTLFFALMTIIIGVALLEYFQLLKRSTGSRRFLWQTLLVTICYLTYLFQFRNGAPPAILNSADGIAIAGLVILLIVSRLGSALEGIKSLDEVLRALFGFVYVTLLFSFMIKILCLPLQDTQGQPSSAWYVLFLVLVTKLTDTGAYCVGSLMGRHKCIPHISPGKTWEGLAGGIAFAFIAAFACRALCAEQLPLLASTPWLIVVTLAIAIASIIGDLSESILKRSLEIKDSGQIMPGIGGALDLVDSLLFTAPVLYFYLTFFA